MIARECVCFGGGKLDFMGVVLVGKRLPTRSVSLRLEPQCSRATATQRGPVWLRDRFT